MSMNRLKNLLFVILLIGMPFAKVGAYNHDKIMIDVVKEIGVCAVYKGETKIDYKPTRAPQNGVDKVNPNIGIIYLTFFSDCGTVTVDVEKEGQGIVSEQLIQSSADTSVPLEIAEFGSGSYNVIVKSELGEVLLECVVILE